MLEKKLHQTDKEITKHLDFITKFREVYTDPLYCIRIFSDEVKARLRNEIKEKSNEIKKLKAELNAADAKAKSKVEEAKAAIAKVNEDTIRKLKEAHASCEKKVNLIIKKLTLF